MAAKVRLSIHSSHCLVWYRMYRLVRTAAEPVRLSSEKCPDCGGTGYTSSRKKISVSIPAGIDNGQSVRIREKGEPGVNGGPRGDLLVEVAVSRHPIFQRQDMHIFSTVPISFAQAALGGDVKIKTVDGDVLYTVKPGTKTDTKIRLKGKGVPSVRNSQSPWRPLRNAGNPDTGEAECRGERGTCAGLMNCPVIH